jgi:hypothetical protein
MTDTTESDSDSTDDIESSGETDSATTRHWLTNDAIALWLAGTYPLLLFFDGLGWIVLADVPPNLRMGLLAIVGIAVAWAFGRDAVAAWRGD